MENYAPIKKYLASALACSYILISTSCSHPLRKVGDLSFLLDGSEGRPLKSIENAQYVTKD